VHHGTGLIQNEESPFVEFLPQTGLVILPAPVTNIFFGTGRKGSVQSSTGTSVSRPDLLAGSKVEAQSTSTTKMIAWHMQTVSRTL